MNVGPLLGFALQVWDRSWHGDPNPSNPSGRSARCCRWLRYLSPTSPQWLAIPAKHSLRYACLSVDVEHVDDPVVGEFMGRVFDLAETNEQARRIAFQWAGESPVAKLLNAIAVHAAAEGLSEVVIGPPAQTQFAVHTSEGVEIMTIPVTLHEPLLAQARLIEILGWDRMRRHQRQDIETMTLRIREDGGIHLRLVPLPLP